jgi:hypothetical protein
MHTREGMESSSGHATGETRSVELHWLRIHISSRISVVWVKTGPVLNRDY